MVCPRMLTDWRREAGFSVTRMLEQRQGSPVVRTEVTYARPMRLDDEVDATMWYLGRSARSFTLRFRFAAGADGPVAAQVQITQVTVEVDEHGEMRPTGVPTDVVAALETAGPWTDG
jgi:acyl-CoA thioesterase FadM